MIRRCTSRLRACIFKLITQFYGWCKSGGLECATLNIVVMSSYPGALEDGGQPVVRKWGQGGEKSLKTVPKALV